MIRLDRVDERQLARVEEPRLAAEMLEQPRALLGDQARARKDP